MKDFLADFVTKLEEGGFGTFASPADWGIYIGMEPSSPLNSITLYETKNNRSFTIDKTTNPPLRYSGFQVRVRCVAYDTGMVKARDITLFLEELYPFMSNDRDVRLVVLENGVLPLGQIQNKCFAFVSNFSVIYKYKTNP
jgi:hypothetical protein